MFARTPENGVPTLIGDSMFDTQILRASNNLMLRPAPINPAWIESGTPIATSALLAEASDRVTRTFLWNCTAGKFTWRYNEDETIYFVDGRVRIAVSGAEERLFEAGDTIHFSCGDVATWTIDSHVRKVAFCRTVPPKALTLALNIARALRRGLRRSLRVGALAAG